MGSDPQIRRSLKAKDDRALDLLRELTRIKSIRAATKQLVRRRLASSAGREQSLALPVDLEAISREFGVIEITRERGLGADAMLVPVAGGFALRLNEPQPSFGRLRFSWAHELVHSLFYEMKGNMPARRIPSGSETEELVCDLGAREILLPESSLESVYKTMSNAAGGSELIARLSKLAVVSPQVMASRLVELGMWETDVISGWLLENRKKSSPYLLTWVVYPDHPDIRFRENARIQPPSILHRAHAVKHGIDDHGTYPWISPRTRVGLTAIPFSQRVVLLTASART